MITKLDAILSLVKNAQVTIRGSDIEWHNPSVAPVSEEQIQAELVRLQAAYDAAEYQRSRSAEYPPITDYLDGVVKGDQAQIDKYIADCQAVKAKYPKGS
ncbi:hypothetical protein [Polynucleobacter sp. MG-27-Goln-C1]|uniref:hypothetical protein n=1 Tax=Polynucleobacter sp. MG-27-Goln-C1 TaxID=1819726 RepID=UPI001C0B0379|nr:hypothetical protein [Polynucleobacter sp. MG-27-Goln-C1]MBU3613188.1 hypothetical protein [Polynucleobacter sp. MG-27-Goln-C1]